MNQMLKNINATPRNSGDLEDVPCLSAMGGSIVTDPTHGQVFYEDQGGNQLANAVMQHQKARSRYVFSKRASQPMM